MGRLERLHDSTVNILTILEKLEENELERDHAIEKIDQLIQEREEIIQLVKAPYTDEEIKIGKEIVHLNEEVQEKMDRIYAEVKVDMKKIKQKKELNRSYINPYGKIRTTDGMYLDSKH